MQKYHLSLRVLHWLSAAIIFFMLVLGFYMNGKLGYNLHKLFGTLLILLFAVRLFARFSTKKPDFPQQIKSREVVLAKLGHGLLYFLIIAMPLSGWLMIDYGSKVITIFDTEIISLVEPNKELRKFMYEVHEFLPFVLIGAIVLHVLAVIKHKIVDKVNLIERIL